MAYSIDKLRNICLLGHGGDGKTSLTESILYAAKAIDRLGKVPEGNTVSDFDSEEIKRGISTSTALAPVEYNGHKINLLDAPGFFDFYGEVVQALRVVDTGLIVLGAKGPISVGSQKMWRLLQEEEIPVAFYVSRLDEENADFYKTFEQMKELFGVAVCPLVIPIIEGGKAVGVVDIVTQKAYKTEAHKTTEIPVPASMNDLVEEYRAMLSENVAETDDELMEKYFGGEEFTVEEMISGIKAGVLARSIAPVFCGSAYTGLGTEALLQGIMDYFPSPATGRGDTVVSAEGEETAYPIDPNGPAVAFVFKTVADQYGRFSFFRVASGTVTSDSSMVNTASGVTEKIGRLYMVRGKKNIEVDSISAGDIGAVAKLSETRTNETLCAPGKNIVLKKMSFPRTCYIQAILPKNKAAEEKLATALARLRDEDPVFENYLNTETRQQVIAGLGDIHLDVLCSRMKTKFGVEVELITPRVAYREKIRKKVQAEGRHKKQSGGHGQYGHVKIEFEPVESDDLVFEERIFGGSVPKNFHPAVEKGLRESMEKGVLAGYPVVNLKAVLYDGSYHEVDSNELSFKMAARLAFRNGLPQANPVIMEPYGTLKVTIPDEFMGDVIGDLNKRRGRIMGMNPDGSGMQIVEAEVPMSEMHSYAIDLRSMTRGWGAFELDFVRYEDAPPAIMQAIIEEAKDRMKEDDDE
ncbi:MAG TPA: elongation factor G [Clostridiales bacterium]|jgi:elongation factor G|nr:elongation factor G [Clostridiales bacterium]